MSFITMAKSIQGEIPGCSLPLVKSKINEALGKIYTENDWSFQIGYSGWLTTGLVSSVGTVTVTPYSATVIADATATAAWATAVSGGAVMTNLQFRDPSYSLYNVISYETTSHAPYATLTLDRVWMEPTSGSGNSYYLYQAYYPVPVADFTHFVEIRDTRNNYPIDFWSQNQASLSEIDAQRDVFSDPCYAVPYGVDQRTGSPTLGYMLYELYPHQLSIVPYSFSYRRKGTLLSNNTDTVQFPLTEELVSWRTKEVLYQWKEAQKGQDTMRGAGADWKFLAQSAKNEYSEILRQIRAVDVNLHNGYMSRPGVNIAPQEGANMSGGFNVGGFRSE